MTNEKIDLPAFSANTIEQITMRILHKFNSDAFTNIEPTPIENIIEQHFNLSLEYHNLNKLTNTENTNLLGMFIFEDGLIQVYNSDRTAMEYVEVDKNTILVENNLFESKYECGRGRFTVAHELGHYVLHGNIPDIQKLNNAIPNTERKWLEWQADTFASCILMPRPLVKKAYYKHINENHDLNELIIECWGTKDYEYYIIGELAKIFNVSKQAMKIRLEKMKLINV